MCVLAAPSVAAAQSFEEMDTNSDGVLDLNEFTAGWIKGQQRHHQSTPQRERPHFEGQLDVPHSEAEAYTAGSVMFSEELLTPDVYIPSNTTAIVSSPPAGRVISPLVCRVPSAPIATVSRGSLPPFVSRGSLPPFVSRGSSPQHARETKVSRGAQTRPQSPQSPSLTLPEVALNPVWEVGSPVCPYCSHEPGMHVSRPDGRGGPPDGRSAPSDSRSGAWDGRGGASDARGGASDGRGGASDSGAEPHVELVGALNRLHRDLSQHEPQVRMHSVAMLVGVACYAGRIV